MRNLKDKELQKRLDEISDGDFSKQLNEHLQNISGRTGMTDADYRVYFGGLPGKREMVNRFSVLFFAHEIEETKDFDPHGWNYLPVVPPFGEMLRIEFVDDDRCLGRRVGVDDWRDYDGRLINLKMVKRFALWDTEKKEETK